MKRKVMHGKERAMKKRDYLVLISIAAAMAIIAWSAAGCRSLPQTRSPEVPVQAGEQVLRFEKGTEGFSSLAGRLLAVQDAGEVREGIGALKFEYEVEPDRLLFFSKGDLSLEGIQSVSFWVRTDSPSLLVVALDERDSSSYSYMVPTRAAEWHYVSAELSDFSLGDDSSDENERLDVDEVGSIAVGDLTALLSEHFQLTGYEKQGLHRLWLDEMIFSPGPKTNRYAPSGRIVLDDLEGALEGWGCIEPGSGTVSHVQGAGGADSGTGALEFRYRTEQGHFTAAGRIGLNLRGLGAIAFRGRSEREAWLAAGLMERDESSYIHPFQVAGGEWIEKEIPLEAFILGEDSDDDNWRLDPDQVFVFFIADISHFVGGPAGPNAIRIDELAGRFTGEAGGAPQRTVMEMTMEEDLPSTHAGLAAVLEDVAVIHSLNLYHGLYLSAEQMREILGHLEQARAVQARHGLEVNRLAGLYTDSLAELRRVRLGEGAIPEGLQDEINNGSNRFRYIERRKNSEMKRLAGEALALLTLNQIDRIEHYNPCLIPPQSDTEPERMGQVADYSKGVAILEAIYSKDREAFEQERGMLEGLVLGGIERIRELDGREFDEEAEKVRITGLIDELRSLDPATFETEKERYSETIFHFEHPHLLLEQKVIANLLNPDVIPYLEQELERREMSAKGGP